MNASAVPLPVGSPATILDRHAIRRSNGIPTVSLLAGPISAGVSECRRWAIDSQRSVVFATRSSFPVSEWIQSAAERIDLPALAIQHLARRAERDADEFLAAWRAKTQSDREQFWAGLAPEVDDDLLRALATQAASPHTSGMVAATLSELGERIIPMLVRLTRSANWPAVVLVARSLDDFSSAAQVAVKWALQVPELPVAIAVPAPVIEEYFASAPESRAKALLNEGIIAIPIIDRATVQRTLGEIGIPEGSVTALEENGVDPSLLGAAVEAGRAMAASPTTESENDRARSAAERFLFSFLESLPETAGRFELNGKLEFRFGPRPAEVDILCRSPRIAIELDGYFHFLVPDSYRRDRTKDWELQRRGFVVLRFLAEDVVYQLELIRDRILDALSATPFGVDP